MSHVEDRLMRNVNIVAFSKTKKNVMSVFQCSKVVNEQKILC